MVSKALDEVYVPASVDPERVIQVTAVISGLESYAAANGTYTVTGGGHNGNGQGWFHFSAGSYPASIFAVLSSHLTSVPSDPLHTNVSAFSRDDFLIYRCMDRVGVFARSDGIQPSDADQAWWSNNNCTTCLLYTSPSPRDQRGSRMPSSA